MRPNPLEESFIRDAAFRGRPRDLIEYAKYLGSEPVKAVLRRIVVGENFLSVIPDDDQPIEELTDE